MARSSRSQFIDKLHQLLEHPLDPGSLRWVTDDTFEITCNDGLARQALSPSFEFRSLSSFIRQLSYYNFKRLSDRRRSSERRSSNAGFIVFTHPSGVFVRGDAGKLHQIVRKTRKRPDKGSRRVSSASDPSDDFDQEPTPDMPAWPPLTTHLQVSSAYQPDDRTLRHYSSLPSFHPPHTMVRHHSQEDDHPAPWKTHVEPRWRVTDRPLTSPNRLEGDAGFLESPPPIRHDLAPIATLDRRQGTDNDERRPSFAGPASAGRVHHFDENVPMGLTIPYPDVSSYAPSFSNPFVPNGLAGPLPSPSASSFTSSPLGRNLDLPHHPYDGSGTGASMMGQYTLGSQSQRERPYYRPPPAYQLSTAQAVPSFDPAQSATWTGPPTRDPSSHAPEDAAYWSSRR